MTKYDELGRIMGYIMEPEEELEARRFIETHKPQLVITKPLWSQDLDDSEIARRNGYEGGYGINYFNFQ